MDPLGLEAVDSKGNPAPNGWYWRVRKGDTLWDISKEVTGSGNNHHKIINQTGDPITLQIGEILDLHYLKDENFFHNEASVRNAMLQRNIAFLHVKGFEISNEEIKLFASAATATLGVVTEKNYGHLRTFIDGAGEVNWKKFINWSKGRFADEKKGRYFSYLKQYRNANHGAWLNQLKLTDDVGKIALSLAVLTGGYDAIMGQVNGDTYQRNKGVTSILAGGLEYGLSKHGAKILGKRMLAYVPYVGWVFLAGEVGQYGIEKWGEAKVERLNLESSRNTINQVDAYINAYNSRYDIRE